MSFRMVTVLTAVWVVPFAIVFVAIAAAFRLLFRNATGRRVLTTALLATVLGAATLQLAVLDPWPGPLFALVLGDDTEFAPGYSAVGFWSVHEGMTADQVLRSAGPPLERYAIAGRPDEEGWRWTRSAHGKSYRIRAVVLRGGKVVAKYSEFYVD